MKKISIAFSTFFSVVNSCLSEDFRNENKLNDNAAKKILFISLGILVFMLVLVLLLLARG